ncbi:MAG: hypothetical protein JO340_05940 [Acidobacteriaceae bacterium]|nr:hypothetical protein [Acidobacteriaceae bacterium]
MDLTEWPPLRFDEWEKTCDTLHLWTQIVGKTRLALTPLENHWWNVPLYLTPRGLTTSPIPFGHLTFEAQFDFVSHALSLQTSEGRQEIIRLAPRSVADFYREYMTRLHSLGIEVAIHRTPVEFDDLTPFDQDQHHASYDTGSVERFRCVLIESDCVLKEFRARFIGKCSPVHFFWGSFDLAVTRFSGRRATPAPSADPITREAYSHEVISCGFWPGDRRYRQAAFYSYTAPAPAGLSEQPVRPAPAYWDANLGEFLLKYEDVRRSQSPREAILDFCQSTYEAGARLAHWDRASLER